MVLNLTGKKFKDFSPVQVLAAKSEQVVDLTYGNIFDVLAWYDQHAGFVSRIIVTPSSGNYVFNNDICNAVMCDVVTLDVEVGENGECNFIPYNPDEL